MRSTGEVMGIDRDFSSAYAKAAMAAGQQLPTGGNVFITMTDKCKPDIVPVAKQLSELGFGIYATEVGGMPSVVRAHPQHRQGTHALPAYFDGQEHIVGILQSMFMTPVLSRLHPMWLLSLLLPKCTRCVCHRGPRWRLKRAA